MWKSDEVLDTLVLGGGPAGLAASLHLSFHKRKILLVDRLSSPMHYHTNPVNNYPGVAPLSTGREILTKLYDELKSYDLPILIGNVIEIQGACPEFIITVTPKSKPKENITFKAKTLLFATGTSRKHPRIKGDWRAWLPFAGKNQISYYCPDCESPLTAGKDILIVNAGSANSGLHVAKLLKPLAKRIRIFMTEDSYIPFTEEQRSILKQSEFEWSSGFIEDIIIDKPKGKHTLVSSTGKKFECDHFFVGFVSVPRSELAKELGVEVDSRGNIITDHRGKTRVQGVWAAGDVRPITQSVAMAVGTGNYAGVMINQFLFNPAIPECERDHPETRSAPK
ncbi:MAG: NAD(P)/FAD-dependent oxidoreductase [Candidatus Ranarchaeia archaeon]|jgi:thioredoxin reductase (NADPH)